MSPGLVLATSLGLGSSAVAGAVALEPVPSEHDGIYGRFDADLDAGAALGLALQGASPALAFRGSLHYFSTAGVYLGFELPVQEGERTGSVLSFGVDLRPAFLPRFSEGMEQGPAWLDLALDSISLSLGPYFPLDRDAERASGLETSLGFGLPFFRDVNGPWLEARALARFPDDDRRAEAGGLVLLSWHAGFGSPWLEPAR